MHAAAAALTGLSQQACNGLVAVVAVKGSAWRCALNATIERQCASSCSTGLHHMRQSPSLVLLLQAYGVASSPHYQWSSRHQCGRRASRMLLHHIQPGRAVLAAPHTAKKLALCLAEHAAAFSHLCCCCRHAEWPAAPTAGGAAASHAAGEPAEHPYAVAGVCPCYGLPLQHTSSHKETGQANNGHKSSLQLRGLSSSTSPPSKVALQLKHRTGGQTGPGHSACRHTTSDST